MTDKNFFNVKREVRKDPRTWETVIIIRGLHGYGSFYDSQVSIRQFYGVSSELIDVFPYSNERKVAVFSPPVSLFVLEDMPINEADGLNDKLSSHGADERLEPDGFGPRDLEGLMNAMVYRANHLHKDPAHGDTQRYFHPYVVHHPSLNGPVFSELSTLTGRLISSWIATPHVQQEMAYCAEYFRERKRCFFCDTVREETLKQGKKSRIIYKDENAVAVIPYASSDPHVVQIIPSFHIREFLHLMPADLGGMIPALYHSLIQLLHDSQAQGPLPEVVNIAFHSAPVHPKREEAFKTSGLVADFYHGHFELSANKRIPRGLETYRIPFAGHNVRTVSPDDIAKRIRN